jgi:hypothetical protein
MPGWHVTCIKRDRREHTAHNVSQCTEDSTQKICNIFFYAANKSASRLSCLLAELEYNATLLRQLMQVIGDQVQREESYHRSHNCEA